MKVKFKDIETTLITIYIKTFNNLNEQVVKYIDFLKASTIIFCLQHLKYRILIMLDILKIKNTQMNPFF